MTTPKRSTSPLRATQASLGQSEDLLVPLGEQPRALRRRAVLREIVVDELDLGEFRRLRRGARVLVGWNLVGHLRLRTDALRLRGKRPVVPLLGVLHVLGAL